MMGKRRLKLRRDIDAEPAGFGFVGHVVGFVVLAGDDFPADDVVEIAFEVLAEFPSRPLAPGPTKLSPTFLKWRVSLGPSRREVVVVAGKRVAIWMCWPRAR